MRINILKIVSKNSYNPKKENKEILFFILETSFYCSKPMRSLLLFFFNNSDFSLGTNNA